MPCTRCQLEALAMLIPEIVGLVPSKTVGSYLQQRDS